MAGSLPGRCGRRIVCVGNVRPEKDHVSLVRALALVVDEVPDAHLLIVGSDRNHSRYVKAVRDEISRHGLEKHVTLIGARDDVPRILHACDIGVLSSISEGLPLALRAVAIRAFRDVA